MATTAADVLVDTLIDWGVDTSSACPATASTASWRRCGQRQDKIRFVQVRHEEAAAFMACAYAKFTGRLGVCLATSGPGGIHLLNGLYDAKLDGQPGARHHRACSYHDLIGTLHPAGRRARQAVQGRRASTTRRVMGPAHVENVAELACRTALAYRGRRAHHHARSTCRIRRGVQRAPLEAQRPAPRLGR